MAPHQSSVPLSCQEGSRTFNPLILTKITSSDSLPSRWHFRCAETSELGSEASYARCAGDVGAYFRTGGDGQLRGGCRVEHGELGFAGRFVQAI